MEQAPPPLNNTTTLFPIDFHDYFHDFDVKSTEKEDAMMEFRNMRTHFHHYYLFLIFAILYSSSSFILSHYGDHHLLLLPTHLHLLFHHPPFIFILLNIIITFILIFSPPKSHHHHLVPTTHNFTTAYNNNYAPAPAPAPAPAAADHESNTPLVTDHQVVKTTTVLLIEPNSVAKEEEPIEENPEKESEEMAMATQINPMDELSSEEFREMIEKFIAANKKTLLSELMADRNMII